MKKSIYLLVLANFLLITNVNAKVFRAKGDSLVEAMNNAYMNCLDANYTDCAPSPETILEDSRLGGNKWRNHCVSKGFIIADFNYIKCFVVGTNNESGMTENYLDSQYFDDEGNFVPNL